MYVCRVALRRMIILMTREKKQLAELRIRFPDTLGALLDRLEMQTYLQMHMFVHMLYSCTSIPCPPNSTWHTRTGRLLHACTYRTHRTHRTHTGLKKAPRTSLPTTFAPRKVTVPTAAYLLCLFLLLEGSGLCVTVVFTKTS